MIAAHLPIQRPAQAKLLVVAASGEITHGPRASFVERLHAGDLVIANDAATLPANLRGEHVRSGQPIEMRLAGNRALANNNIRHFSAVVFGAGDYHTRTEDRPLPPAMAAGDQLVFGPLRATIEMILNHPRLIEIRFEGTEDEIWSGLARHGRPIQYAHMTSALELWDVWTPFAGPPVAFEPPSAGFALDWKSLATMRRKGVLFSTLTHAAGISSTGDAKLDARLPLPEAYFISSATALAIDAAKKRNGRVIAIGTTVVRALEAASTDNGSVQPGYGVATLRIDGATRLRVVSAILSGTHEPTTSHYDLLQAFIDPGVLARVDDALNANHYQTHEFGDSIFFERQKPVNPSSTC